MPNFLGGGTWVGVETVGFEAGGGPQGMDGRFPDKPCDRTGSFGGEEALVFFVDPVAVESDCIELASLVPSSCALSRDVVDIWCALSTGGSIGVSLLSGLEFSSLCVCVISEGCMLDTRGVEADEGGRFSVMRRVEFEDC